MVKTHNEVTTATLSKIRLIKVNDEKWICKVDYDSSNEQPAEAKEEEEDEEDDVVDANEGHDEPMADAPPSGYENYFAGFEERMMTQLHTMNEEGKSHHQYGETKF